MAGGSAPRPRRAACTPRTERGTPPASTRSGRAHWARPAPGRGVGYQAPRTGTPRSRTRTPSQTAAFRPSQNVNHCASRTFTTNQPSPAGASPEPESSSGASGTPRVYGRRCGGFGPPQPQTASRRNQR
jgi:hypothetical protein